MRFSKIIFVLIPVFAVLGWMFFKSGGSSGSTKSPAESDAVRSGSVADLTEISRGMNVVLIAFDTVAAKHLDLTNRSGPFFLQQLAAESAVFSKAYSAAPWTRPALGSVMTGYHPRVHGIQRIKGGFNKGVHTLAEMFSMNGYRTAGFVSHEFISPKTDFRRGFETYEIVPLEGGVHFALTSGLVVDRGLSFLERNEQQHGESSFFLFMHFFDPHYNYRHHEKFDRTSWYKGKLYSNMPFKEVRTGVDKLSAEDRRYLESLHQEEIAYSDEQIRRFFETLKKSPYADNTIVVVTADHGEEFLEHGGVGHGQSMYDEVLQVPLMVWAPKKIAPHVISRWVSTMDIVPTLVAEHEPIASAEYRGESLLFDSAHAGGERRALLADVAHNAHFRAILEEPFKFIHNIERDSIELYDLSQDSAEKNNLGETAPQVTGFKQREHSIEQDLAPFDSSDTSTGEERFSPEEVKKLKSLGYLG